MRFTFCDLASVPHPGLKDMKGAKRLHLASLTLPDACDILVEPLDWGFQAVRMRISARRRRDWVEEVLPDVCSDSDGREAV